MLGPVSEGEKDVANIPRSMLSTILKSKEGILKAVHTGSCCGRKKMGDCNLDGADADEAVFKWFTDIHVRDIPIGGPVVQHKARDCVLRQHHLTGGAAQPEVEFAPKSGSLTCSGSTFY